MCCKRGRELVENEEQGKNKKMKSIVVEEQEQEQEQEEGSETGFVFDLDEDMLHNVLKRVDLGTLGRAACVNKLWLDVASAEDKKMKSIVVEEQEQEQEEGSETRFVDLNKDTLFNVLKRVDVVTLGRAACVNKLWCEVAEDNRLWEPLYIRYLARRGQLQYIDEYGTAMGWRVFSRLLRRRVISDIVGPPPDFYSIDFSKKIEPWVLE